MQGSHRTLQLGVDVPGIGSINDILHLSLALHQLVHVLGYLVIGDDGIDLGASQVGMPHHLGDAFH